MPAPPFGRVLTAMITPMSADGAVDLDGAAQLAAALIDGGHDGLVINGTTGESPTTSDAEKESLVRVVVDAVGGRAHVIAGVGTNDTTHTQELARSAEKAGATGLLVVTPYYSKPPQPALVAHFEAVAGTTGLPVMLYDIPGRTGVPLHTDTLLRLGEHPSIVAVKDAKDDLAATSQVLAGSDLAYYSGTDALNLPLLAVGAVGMVSVVGHLVGPRLRALVDAFTAGEVDRARELNFDLQPVYAGIFRSQGVVLVKAALGLLGLPAGPVRLPLLPATAEQVEVLRGDLTAGGVRLAA